MKKKILIAVDCDGTIIPNKEIGNIKPNQRILDLITILGSFKNTRIMIWSGQGKDYANAVILRYGIQKAFAASKIDPDTWVCGKPDIAIDDLEEFNLGTINLIVRESNGK